MPVLYTEIPLEDIRQILFTRGYGDAYHASYALTFNKPTGRVFSDGSQERKPLPGLTEQQVKLVVRHSKDATDAANRIERIMLGQDMPPFEGSQTTSETEELSMQEVEALVTNRVKHEVTQAVAPIVSQIAQVLTDFRAEMAAAKAAPAKKKPGRPPKVQPEPELPPLNVEHY